ncbi:PEP-CTERM sorting domain-containing protein [Congregibacter sp.]|jgi:hypothetical protein|uniref:PEP-CTERM sorting domain-containing protein n=1 Tax=Congregibacter sp. TaxID=2744308 RepID=UPI0039E6CA4B
MRTAKIRVATALVTFGLAAGAAAGPFTEVGDAGETIATALAVGSGVTSISGSVGDLSLDFYELFYASDVLFQVSNITPFSFGITELTLFNESGTQLATCADCFFKFGGLGSVVISTAITSGTYYLSMADTVAGVPFGDYSFGITETSSVSPVPLPGTLALCGLGLAGLGWKRRKQA